MKKPATGSKRSASSAEQSHNAFHGVISGRVQGVGFRVFARESAVRHGVKGWVRNLRDGTVEVYAEADELTLTEFLTDLYRGPIISHVNEISLEWKHSEVTCGSFEILR